MKIGVFFCGDVVVKQPDWLFSQEQEIIFATNYSAAALLDKVDSVVLFWDERSPQMLQIKELFENAGKSVAVVLASANVPSRGSFCDHMAQQQKRLPLELHGNKHILEKLRKERELSAEDEVEFSDRFKRKMNRVFREQVGLDDAYHPEVDTAYERFRSRIVRCWPVLRNSIKK